MPETLEPNSNPPETKPPVEQTGEVLVEKESDKKDLDNESAPTTDETEAKDKINKKKTAKKNKEVVAEALLEMDEIDPDFLKYFEKALEEKGESSAEVEGMKELIEKIPEIFKEFDQKIEALSGQEGFSEIKKKSSEIKSSLIESVANGHLEAGDVLNMVSSVEIYSPPPDDPLMAQFGYDATMFVHEKTGRIFIVDKALKDKSEYLDANNQPIKIDFKHTMVHELSHIVDKRAGIDKNEKLLAACDDLIKMENFADTQSMHIRHALKEGKDENQKRAEIIADYTALYLKSDGSFIDFVSECIKMTGIKQMQEQYGLKDQEIRAILKKRTSGEQILEKIKENNPKFAGVLETYKTFYQEISNGVKENKGKIEPPEESEEEGSEIDFSNYFAETAQASREAPQNSKKEEGVVSLFLGLVKAMGDETVGQAIPQAGPGL